MKTTSPRARALGHPLRSGTLKGTLCALLAGTALCGLTAAPAAAQSSPTYRNLDSNGVDLVKGDFLTGLPEGSIGSGEAELVLLRMIGATGSNGTQGTSQWDRILFNIVPSGAYVDFGSRNDKFPGAESRGVSLAGSGGSYQYRSPDGTAIAFGNPAGTNDPNYCDSTAKPSCILLPTSITSPDGKVVNINYEFWSVCYTTGGGGSGELMPGDPEPVTTCSNTPRIFSVTNSHGYEIRFAYASPAGSGSSPPPSTFHERTRASFHNNEAVVSPPRLVIYGQLAGGVTRITDAGGLDWFVTSNSTGNSATYAIRRPGAASDTTSATLIDGVVQSVFTEGVTTHYARSAPGNVATMTVTQSVPGGASPVTTVESDLTTGRPKSVRDPLGHVTSYEYDPSGRLKKVTAPEGNYVEHGYDDRGNVVETIAVPKGGTGPRIVTSAIYDPACANPKICNRPISTTDARGNVTDYSYDPAHGGVLTVTAPAPAPGAPRPQTRYTYTLLNDEHKLTGISQCRTASACAGTPDEVKTALAYDANGNLYWTATGDGTGTLVAAVTMGFDPTGNLVSVDGPLPGPDDTGRIRYNMARQVEGTVSPDPDGSGGPLKPRAVRNVYDSTTGLLERAEQGVVNSRHDPDWASFAPAQAVETIYDANARPVASKRLSGSAVYALTQWKYDALGRVDCVARRMDMAGFAAALPEDACALTVPAGSAGPDRIARTRYDLAGRVTEVTTALGTDASASEIRKAHTANGLVHWAMDGEGNKTTYQYDGHDRLERTYFPLPDPKGAQSSNAGDFEQLTYESLAGGARTSGLVAFFRNRGNQTIGFSHDPLGRMTYKDLPGTEPDVTYAYDLLGRLTSASQPGQTLGFTYDALGRVLDQTGPLGTIASQWDLAGRRTRLTWPDGFHVTYDHLVTGETTHIRENGAASGIGVLATLAYDDLGRRTSLTLGNGVATNYQYDPLSRLGEHKLDFAGAADDLTSTFAYNPASQIASSTRSNDSYAWTGHGSGTTTATSNGIPQSANGLNQIGSWVSPLGYDAKGNVTTDGATTYTYSSENLLTSFTNPGGTAQTSSTFAYDPLMRLAVIDSTNAGFDVQFGYDGQEMAYEGLSNGRTRRYVHGPGTDEILVGYLVTATGTSRLWYQADERGSITRLSNDAGTPGGIGKYDEFGAGGTSRFRYTGQYWLGEANLLYYRARVYDARLGRFLQPDPIGYGDGMNLYAYVGGDPVNFTDPSGTCGAGEVGIFQDRTSRGEGEGVVALYRVFCQRLVFDGSGNGVGGMGVGDNGGGGADAEKTAQCKLGNGAIDVRFDGTTLNITANINLVGPGAATSGDYIGGIAQAWTRSFGHINSIANISAGPGGVTAHISSEKYPPADQHGHHGPRADRLGGNNIWLGNLGAMPDWQRPFATKHVGAHEFGHLFGIPNMRSVGKWAKSIMANSANDVSPTDLEAVVDLCRAAE